MGFDGSSITGFNAIEESDMIAIPDQDVPADARRRATVRRGADDLRRRHPRRQPYEGDPRFMLRVAVSG